MKKINVLHLLTGLGLGGAEKFVLDLAVYSDELIFQVFVLGISKNDTLLEEFYRRKINVFMLNKKNSFSSLFSIVRETYKFIIKNKIEVIHAHMFHSIVIACAIKIFYKPIKIVYTPHSINIGSIWREILVWCLRPFREKDIAFSINSVKFFYIRDYQIIPNGVNVNQYKKIQKKNDIFKFISVGRLEFVKNHHLLIECAKSLIEKYSFILYIVGDGSLRKDFERLIQAYKADAYIKLLGARNDVPDLLGQSSCFLMPSLWEGMPISLLEAGACGLPIISTPAGDIPSLIDDSNGYLCLETDFCKNMEYVMNNYQEAKSKASRFQKKVIENYSIEKIIERHEDLYKTVCRRGGCKAPICKTSLK